MKRYLVAAVVAMFAAALLTTGAQAGGGTGITATPAATVTWAGTFTAQFVRSASGIINETNRVNSAGPQNEWSPYDVRLQFRPQTNPTGGVVPNPACEAPASLVTPVFPYTNSDPAIAGTFTSGYFLPDVTYNVCVYLAHPFALTLLGNGGTNIDVNAGDHVVYTGHYSNGSVAIAGAPVTLDVFTGFGCTTALYSGISAGVTDGSGNYSFDGGPAPFGDYSVRGSTANATSNCIDISVAHNYSLTLLANGAASIAVHPGDPIQYSGVFMDGPTAVAGAAVSLDVFNGSICDGASLVTLNAGLTDSGGAYALGPNSDTVAAPLGTFSLHTTAGGVTSNCVIVTVS